MCFQRSPFVVLSLYVAASFYMTDAQEEGLTPTYVANIEFLFTAMEAIGKHHVLTLNFLRQAIAELREAGLDYAIRVPKVPPPPGVSGTEPLPPCTHIPLFARSRISKRTAGILPPLPGRLPLSKPMGLRREAMPPGGAGTDDMKPREIVQLDPLFPAGSQRAAAVASSNGQEQRTANNKRRRVNMSPEPTSSAMRSGLEQLPWSQNGPVEEILSPGDTSFPAGMPKNLESCMNLPHRAGGGDSSTSGSSPGAAAMNGSSTTTTPSSGTTGKAHAATSDATYATAAAPAPAPMASGAQLPPGAGLDMDMFTGLNGWNGGQDAGPQYAEVAAAMLNDDSWMMLNDVGGNGPPWGSGTGGAGVG